MNIGPNHPGGGPGNRRRRRRGRRGPPARPGQQPHGSGPRNQGGQPGIYTAPMDHSYRGGQGRENGAPQMNRRGGRPPMLPKHFQAADIEPLPLRENAATRIFAFVEDLFFVAKIQETSRKLNVKVEFVKSEKDIEERMAGNGGETPSLIIMDLNNAAAKPLTAIPKLKARFKKATTIIGFLSHVQGDLKLKAQDAGCDVVVPRSAFSQNLPQLLRRHGAADEPDQPVA